jgi:hypothetical protein
MDPGRDAANGRPLPIGDILPRSVGGRSVVADPLVDSPERLAPVTTLRPSPSDDEGGPGDSPASVRWLRAGGQPPTDIRPPTSAGTIDGRAIDPETGVLLPPERRTDRLGRPYAWDPPAPPTQAMGRGGRAPSHSSVARVEPEPPPLPRGGSTVDLSPWERWLGVRSDRRFPAPPRHPRRAACSSPRRAGPGPAPLERASISGRVVEYDKRDVEAMAHQARPARPAHALGHR